MLPWLADADDGEFFAWLREQAVEPHALRIADLATNALALAACRAGAGLSVQPYAVVEADLAAGRLVEVPARHEPDLAYFVLHVPGPLPEPARLFLRWLRSVA